LKKATLVLLCCSAFLYACDSSKDTAVESGSAAVDSAKESVSSAMSGTFDSAKDVSTAVATKTSEVIATVAGSDDTKLGETIYKSKCVACHGTGAAGSPKLDDKAAWEARIAQGNEVLTQHAIKGFKGNTGYMPPKGGYMSLSDEDISLVVQYMVSQAQ
jgi:cytochrome c5